MALSPEGAEHLLSLVAPQIRHNRCSHKNEQGRWTYWEAGSGLCWCNKCGMCLNGTYENAPEFFMGRHPNV